MTDKGLYCINCEFSRAHGSFFSAPKFFCAHPGADSVADPVTGQHPVRAMVACEFARSADGDCGKDGWLYSQKTYAW